MDDRTFRSGFGTGHGVAESAGEENGNGSSSMDMYTDRQLLFVEMESTALDVLLNNGYGESLGEIWQKRYRGS